MVMVVGEWDSHMDLPATDMDTHLMDMADTADMADMADIMIPGVDMVDTTVGHTIVDITTGTITDTMTDTMVLQTNTVTDIWTTGILTVMHLRQVHHMAALKDPTLMIQGTGAVQLPQLSQALSQHVRIHQ